MSEVMSECDSLCQILVEVQRSGDRPCNLGNLEGMCQSGTEVVTLRRQKHLCLMHQPAKCLGMNDAVAIALKLGADLTLCFRETSAFGFCALGRVLRKNLVLAFF